MNINIHNHIYFHFYNIFQQNMLRNIKFLPNTHNVVEKRLISSNSEISPTFVNRNPRNLERMRIGYKPDGYHVDKPGKCFWHKLQLTVTQKYVTASIIHFKNGEVLSASTTEWALKKQLYDTKDTSAFINLGRVLADRCLQCGLNEIRSDIVSTQPDGKVALFLKALEDGGVKLEEPPQFKVARPWDQHRPEKPWDVIE